MEEPCGHDGYAQEGESERGLLVGISMAEVEYEELDDVEYAKTIFADFLLLWQTDGKTGLI